MSKKVSLYLDDLRTPTETLPGYHPWNVVRNYDEFKEWILRNGVPDLISFDHDLGEEHMNDNEFWWGLTFGVLIGGLINFAIGFYQAMRDEYK